MNVFLRISICLMKDLDVFLHYKKTTGHIDRSGNLWFSYSHRYRSKSTTVKVSEPASKDSLKITYVLKTLLAQDITIHMLDSSLYIDSTFVLF